MVILLKEKISHKQAYFTDESSYIILYQAICVAYICFVYCLMYSMNMRIYNINATVCPAFNTKCQAVQKFLPVIPAACRQLTPFFSTDLHKWQESIHSAYVQVGPRPTCTECWPPFWTHSEKNRKTRFEKKVSQDLSIWFLCYHRNV